VTLQFYFDECSDEDVARALIALGIDVITVRMANRKGYSDPEQLDFARQENRVTYTTDPDFLRLAADYLTRGEIFPGVVFHAQGARTKREIIDALILLDGVFNPEDMVSKVEFI
jgi:predicted nuclease of predicted toxin-antitoxin system